MRDQIQQLQIANDTLNLNSESQPPTKKKALDTLFGKEESNPPVTLEDEMDILFSETGAPRNSDPLTWWKNNSLRHPCISQLVKSLFAIPATSTSSERLFSVAGLTVTRLRSGLIRENINALIFLHNNYALVSS